MEVLHRPTSLHASQQAMFYRPVMQHVLTTPTDSYTCYSFDVNTPSRTPTPERSFRTYSKHGPSLDTPSHPTTLQSVLHGVVPAAYSHLTTSALQHPSLLKESSVTTNSLYVERDSSHRSVSPCLSVHSSSSYSSRPSSRESHTSLDSFSDCQTQPMDLSCKRTSRKRSAVSAFLDVASMNNNSSLLSSSLPAKFSSTSSFSISSSSSSSSFPSSSPPMPSMPRYPPSPAEGHNGEFSLLRNLLSVGKHHHHHTTSFMSESTPNLTTDRICDSPASDSFPRTPITGTTKVQLAKKNLFPVSRRVSDWLVKIIQFAESIPEFSALPHNDKITLILNSWAPIVLLYMAESNFQFAVTPSTAGDPSVDEVSPSQDEPTMKAVEGLQTFITKCQQMSVDAKEYDFFRMLVLFNSGYPGLSSPNKIDQISSVVQQLLQQHVCVSRPRDVMHYSRLLMCLPSLYSTNSRMFGALFCKHITKSLDMEMLLKDLLKAYHNQSSMSMLSRSF
ncbi:unnamed protein product [Candidula unifasciata]|uniref:NR LBD domain-containing protein n=1 Tax=Candidula unifasciata TaxID=100452 RepID=A0A8S3ZL00_9EUPU|nr:unnamed protein product [Candidula unifasciata]